MSNQMLEHNFLDLPNGFGGIESLGTDIDAVHDGVAAEQAIGALQRVKAFGSGLVTTVGDETVSLQQRCRATKFIGIPPE